MQTSRVEKSFNMLSLRDVLDARDAYHIHLLNQSHVIATAVGRYLVRVSEEDSGPMTPDERLTLTPGARGPRTLENSRVQDWSWPCVLVFVDHWMTEDEIRENPDEMVPRRLYLPDGKVVPTCVVYAPPAHDPPPAGEHLSFPSVLVGGGYVCASEVQGRQRIGSIACLVTDGDLTYALTNRHVAGEPGRVLYTMVSGTYVRIGTAAERSVTRVPFAEMYPGFAGSRMELAIDAGLIEVDDVQSWTTQVFGIGRLRDVVDVGPESLTLDLIGLPLKAFGAASGELSGELLALYYRYSTRTGIEYVADLLIGPRGEEPLQTRVGDSGTLWVLDPGELKDGSAPNVVALAMEWGGDRLVRDMAGASSPYALASFMSNVCRKLDVEVIYDWNANHNLYWGQVGHYTIAAKACELLDNDALRAFFLANRANISFELADIEAGKYNSPDGTTFYPLADVPDLVWKMLRGHIRPHEKPNHFADMDDEADGDTLLSLFEQDPASIAPERWLAFYDKLGATPSQMGLLPFRVGQLYSEIVESLRAGGEDASTRALCAAGTMAHYVGDACQPLHVSKDHNGRNEAEKGVHETYETKMVGKKRAAIIAGLDEKLAKVEPLERITGTQQAAESIAALMHQTFDRIDPGRICDVFMETGGDAEQMWDALGDATLECIVAGCHTLAMLWSSAWAEADAEAPAAVAADQTALRDLYLDPDFAPSRYLTELVTQTQPAAPVG